MSLEEILNKSLKSLMTINSSEDFFKPAKEKEGIKLK